MLARLFLLLAVAPVCRTGLEADYLEGDTEDPGSYDSYDDGKLLRYLFLVERVKISRVAAGTVETRYRDSGSWSLTLPFAPP